MPLLVASCIVEAPGSDKSSGAARRTVLAPAAPLSVRSGANLGDKVEIVGAAITPGRAEPGESLRVSVAFNVKAALEADYVIFVHIEDATGHAERLNADHRPSRPTQDWKPGEVVRDEFSIYVPPGSGAKGLNIYLGFWDPKTDARLVLKNPGEVKSDGNNRILIASVPVGI